MIDPLPNYKEHPPPRTFLGLTECNNLFFLNHSWLRKPTCADGEEFLFFGGGGVALPIPRSHSFWCAKEPLGPFASKGSFLGGGEKEKAPPHLSSHTYGKRVTFVQRCLLPAFRSGASLLRLRSRLGGGFHPYPLHTSFALGEGMALIQSPPPSIPDFTRKGLASLSEPQNLIPSNDLWGGALESPLALFLGWGRLFLLCPGPQSTYHPPWYVGWGGSTTPSSCSKGALLWLYRAWLLFVTPSFF